MAVILLALVFAAGEALAASARGLAVARAFSYAYNNPQQEVGAGAMGSSMYSGGGFNAPPVSGIGGTASSRVDSPLGSMVNRVYYTPMTPVALSSGGMTASAGGSYANPIREVASVLGERDAEGFSLDTPPLKSLAPRRVNACRDAMLKGEDAFRKANYEEALAYFKDAKALSFESPESLLSLVHVYFALGEKYYAPAAEALAKVLDQLPGVMQVRVRPKDFFGNLDEYKKKMAALEAYAKEHAKDASILFLLSYMQYRDGAFDKALTTLDAAEEASPAKNIQPALVALNDGYLRTGQVLLAGAPKMAEPRDYAWAGIRMALPAAFSGVPLASPNQVVSGVIDNGKEDLPSQFTLYAYPLNDGGMTLPAFMDYMMNSLGRSSSVKDLVKEAELEIPFPTGRALVRLFNYRAGESDARTYMGWVAFIREPKDKNGSRVAYVLGLAVSEKQSDNLLPTLASITKSIKVTDLAHPAVSTIDVRGDVVEDTDNGFSITQPWGWAGRPTDRGFEMGQMDFARGNGISPRVELVIQTVADTQTPQSLVAEAAKRKPPQGMTRKVLSQGPTRLAGQEGYQIIGTQSPQDGVTGVPSILLCRIVCVNLPDGHKKMYAMVVDCRDAQVKDVEGLADKVAETLRLLKQN